MPAPYSDNMYSFDDGSGDEQQPNSSRPTNPLGPIEAAAYDDDDALQALSPSDGYFHALNSSEAGVAWGTGISASGDHSPLGMSQPPMSSQVPHVPDVWVEDPSLQESSTAAGKAREAEQERVANNRAAPERRSPSPVARSPPRRQPYAPYVSIPPPQSPAGTSSGPPFSPTHSRVSASVSTSSRATNHRYTPSSSSHLTRSAYTPVAASIYSSDAPPAYTASPTSPSSASAATAFSHATDTADYQTFARSAMGRPNDETQPLIRHAPEDMGGPRDRDGDLGGDVPWHRRVSRYVPAALTWKRCRGILIAAVIVLGLWMLFGTTTDAEPPKGRPPPTGPDSPPGAPDAPDAPERYPDFPFGDIGFPESSCGNDKHEYPVQEYPVSFKPNHILYVAQQVDKDHGHNSRSLHVTGDIVLRRQQADGPSGIVLEMVSNDEKITPQISFEQDEEHGESLTIVTPPTVPWSGPDHGPCLTIRVTIWVPEDAALSTLEIGAVQLGIKLLDNLRLDVTKHAILRSVTGNVIAATTGDRSSNADLVHNGPPAFFKLNCRTIMVKTTSSDIEGSWPLLDFLSLESVSGHITAGVVPKAAGEESTVPAELQVETTSGNIEVWEPVDKVGGSDSPTDLFPPRHYVLKVKSTSGNIKGALAFSKAANIQTTSGNTDVIFLPVLPSSVATLAKGASRYSLLETYTTSGTSHFTVRDPLWVELADQLDVLPVLDSAAFVHVMQSYHRSLSANIRIDYPAAWQGDIHAKTMSGGLLVSGKDVRVIKMGGKWPGVGKEMLARKGHLAEGAGSDVSVESTSGTIKILFPED